VFAGGTLLVAAAERLPAGALRALAGDGRTAVVAHGFGSVYALPALGDEAVVADLARKRAPLGNGPLPAPEAFWHAQEVPGLGDVNISVFLAISLVFALAVGPVNFLWLRRRRRPLLILLTVPVLGFGTTLVILGYGFLHDGFGVRGVVTSWTYVDQPRREAATIAARTLFSGLTPGGLLMGAESLLLAPRATEGRRGLDRWHYDHEAQRLDGGALPSRVTTPLIGVQQSVARQRLLMRIVGERAELATDGGVQAVGTAVLCDPDGGLWVGPPAALQRVDRAAADAALADVLRRSGSLVAQNPSSYAAEDRFTPWSVGALAERMAGTLRPGEYVVTVTAAPWLDEHGLAIAYDRSLHVVRGVLGKEDCQR
jgi:hypothetical protein